MSYLGLNSQRFKFLLNWGCDPSELRDFLSKRQKPLIQAGVKAQNIPDGHSARVRLLAYNQDERATPLIKAWFAGRLQEASLAKPAEIISYFMEVESRARVPDDDETRRFARSALIYIFGDNCDSELVSYLRSELPGEEMEQPEPEPQVVQASEMPSSPLKDSDLALVAKAILQPDVALAQTDLSQDEFEKFVRSLLTARKREWKVIEGAPPLTEGSNLRTILERSLAEFRKKTFLGAQEARGTPLASGSEIPQHAEVIGYCYHLASGGEAFIEPLALWDGNSTRLLVDENARKDIFPTTGQLMAFPRTAGLRLPSKGEAGIWQFETYDSGKPIRTKIKRSVNLLLELTNLAVDSSDYDGVRGAISALAAERPGQAVFELADGLVIRSRKSLGEVIQSKFAAPFDAWHAVPAFHWKDRKYVILAPGDADFPYDCAEIEVVLKKLLALEGKIEQLPKLTKNNIRDLMEAFRAAHHEVDFGRVENLRQTLERYLTSENLLAQVTSMLMEQPKVKGELDRAIASAASSAVEQKSQLIEEIAKLRGKAAQLQRENTERETAQKALPSQVAKVVRDSFEKAKRRGIESLGELAVFEALLRPVDKMVVEKGEHETHDRAPRDSGIFGSALDWKFQSASNQSLDEVLSQFGVVESRIVPYGLALKSAVECGVFVCLSGVVAGAAAVAVARAICAGGVWTAPIGVGVLDGRQIEEKLRELEDGNVGLVLRNVNFSEFESFAAAAIDLVAGRLVKRDSRNSPVIVVSISEAVSALPLSRVLRKMGVLIDIDEQGQLADCASSSELLDLINAKENDEVFRPWKPLIKRMVTMVSAMDAAEQALVWPVFRESIEKLGVTLS